MFENMDIFAKANSLAKHAAKRQSVIAQNIANADTPGFRAKDMTTFSEVYDNGKASHLRASRAGHLLDAPSQDFGSMDTIIRPTAPSPNGNTVSLETEMVAATEAKRDHDLALTIYRTSLGIMRSAIGRR